MCQYRALSACITDIVCCVPGLRLVSVGLPWSSVDLLEHSNFYCGLQFTPVFTPILREPALAGGLMIPGQIAFFFLKHDMQNCCFVTWKFGLTFRKIWNRLRLIHLSKNIKKSCYLARLPVDLRFICLSHSVILRWCHYFPFYLPLYIVTHPTPCTKACFYPLFLLLLYAYFTWRWFDAFYYFL